MKRHLWPVLLGYSVVVALCFSCKEDRVNPGLAPLPIGLEIPFPDRNPFTADGIKLGRMLFYDPILSKNGMVSCATCHQQEKAFTDRVALSKAGVSGRPLLRHAPSLVNLAWANDLFWDGGAKDLEAVSFGPLLHADEMGQELSTLTQTLQEHDQYPKLFKQAFGTDSITSRTVSRALAQFLRTLISANSRYDKYVRNEPDGALTTMQLNGLTAFNKYCSSCHATDLFTDHRYHNNGLDSTFSIENEQLLYGRGRITRLAADVGKYKTPTLRNITLTGPYMHDGRFQSLEEVLEHYRAGVVPSPTLATQLRQGQVLGIPLSDADKESILAFLQTLTDEGLLKQKALANPFE